MFSTKLTVLSLMFALLLPGTVMSAVLAPQGAHTAALEEALLEGSPTAPLGLACQAALADMFSTTDCLSADIVECTTQSAIIFQWRMLCMSGVMRNSTLQDTVGLRGAKGVYIQWSKVHPLATSYFDLWLSPLDGGFGPVAKEVLAQSNQTKLMVLELAQAPNIDRDLRVVFRRLALQMGIQSKVLIQALPKPIKVSLSSLPGGPPIKGSVQARTQQAAPPFNVITVPITGSHPLQNFARFQTVIVGTTSITAQYRFDTPPINSLAVNTSDSEWLASFSAASGYLAEGYNFKMVYSAASAADTMTAKAEASFSGYGVRVSAEFSKTESSSSQSSGIFFDYSAKKVFNPDPSNLVQFGIPLSNDLKKDLRDAVLANRIDTFYNNWGNHVVFGFTRAVRYSSKVDFRFASSEEADSLSAKISGKYKGWGVSVKAAAEFARSTITTNAEATLTAVRDFLPVGFQDTDALADARACVVPQPIFDISDLNAEWAESVTDVFSTCSRGVGVPTATQGDRTHALLIPMAYLPEFQEVIYKALAGRSATLPVLGNLLADLARLNADPEVIIRINRIWGAGKQLQRASLPFLGETIFPNLTTVYGKVGNILRQDLPTSIRANIKACDPAGCEPLLIALNNVASKLEAAETDFVNDLPYLRDGIQVFREAAALRTEARRKLTPLTAPRERVDAEADRISSIASLLIQQGTGQEDTVSVEGYVDENYLGGVVFNKTFAPDFITGTFNATDCTSPDQQLGVNCSLTTVPPPTVQSEHDRSIVINAVDGETYRGTLVGTRFVGDLTKLSSLKVGTGVVVTLFQKPAKVPPPQPLWWPFFWAPWTSWFFGVLYPVPLNVEIIITPRTFFAAGNYTQLDSYIADYNDKVWALRVDRFTQMTALRKAAIMKRLKEDLLAVKNLLDNTPGDTAKK